MHAQRGFRFGSVVRVTLTTLALLALSPTSAHEWDELDASRVLAQADAIVAVAEIVQAAWIADTPATLAPAAGSDDAPSDGGAVEFVCDCSCSGVAALEAAAEDVEALGPAGMSQAAAIAQCAMTCGAQWATCEE